MRTVVITPPDAIITLEQAKAHLRVDHDHEDTLIASLVSAATGVLDGPAGWLGRAIGEQTIEWTDARFGCDGFIELPFPPIVSVTSIKYLDSDGEEQIWATDQYSVIGSTVWLAPGESWPSVGSYPDAVRIRYQAGYTTVPEAIKVAILLHVGTLYENRESAVVGTITAVLPNGYAALLAPYRVWS